MGMENLLNYYFIMKKRFVTVLLACSLAGGLFAQQPWFKDKDLTLTGAYYYPEHWDESQWERDFKQMHDLGFEFTHFAEFAWAQLEPEEGKYDFSWLDKAVALAAKYDLKVIMCTLNPQLHSRSATYIKRNGLLIRKITIKSSRPFQCAYHPLTP